MALTLLRHLGRTGAAPLFVAETRSEDFAARWHAMRELIALDPAAARPHLAAMAASDRHSEVRAAAAATLGLLRSEEHTSELQSLMRISYAVFCLKKTKQHKLKT